MDIENQTISQASILSARLINYKNYEAADVTFSPDINFFVGPNGAGKTNLLDALHYLCVTRGFVTPQDRYNIRFGAEFFRLEAEVARGDRRHRVTVKVRPGAIKEISVDGAKAERLADHIGFLPVIVLTPADQELIKGPSAGRRRFVDFYLSQTDRAYLEDLMSYNRLLAQRNALLKENGPRAERQLLMTYSTKMQPHDARITAKRQAFLQQLKPLVTDLYGTVSALADDVSIHYQPDTGALSLEELARSTIEKDCILGRTTRGIHRDDVAFAMNERAIRRYGSQGQMKTYLIALHLAMREYIGKHSGVAPVVLMDDIFGKLDDKRIQALVTLLSGPYGGQVFITDARRDRTTNICRSLGGWARVVAIEEARISSVTDYGNSVQKKNFTVEQAHDQEE